MSGRVAAWPRLTGREWLWAALLMVTFAPALAGLAGIWSSVDYLSHGFLVPLVALWAALRERPRRARLEVQPDGGGAALLVAAIAVYVLGLVLGSLTVQGLALVAGIGGAVLLTRGRAWLRALAFPVGFLLFMVPPPPSWVTPVILQLQFFVSATSLLIARALGVAVLRDGNVIALPGGDTLFVAEACSGVTSIITLTPLAVFLAYFSLKSGLARALLVVAVIPLAMTGNLVRVVLTILASVRWGAAEVTSGPLHEVFGLLTYIVACSLMLGLGAALRRVFGPR